MKIKQVGWIDPFSDNSDEEEEKTDNNDAHTVGSRSVLTEGSGYFSTCSREVESVKSHEERNRTFTGPVPDQYQDIEQPSNRALTVFNGVTEGSNENDNGLFDASSLNVERKGLSQFEFVKFGITFCIFLALLVGLVFFLIGQTLPGNDEVEILVPAPSPIGNWTQLMDACELNSIVSATLLRNETVALAKKIGDFFGRTNELSDEGSLVCNPASLTIWTLALTELPEIRLYSTTRYALAFLFFSTQGHQWVQNENWLSSESPCTWFGVNCSTIDNRIDALTGIHLERNSLQGTLPDELYLLISLRTLNLKTNFINGRLPEQFYLLSNLEELDLRNVHLEGTLPSTLSRMTNLKKLQIQSRSIMGPLPNLSNLLNLEMLGLDLPSYDKNVPSEIGLLTKLTYLFLGGNFDGKVTEQIFLLPKLEELRLMGAPRLQGTLPDEMFIRNNTNWRVIDIRNSDFNGTIPSAIGRLKELKHLQIQDCGISGIIPPEIGSCEALEKLIVQGCKLSGSVPEEIGNLHAVETIDFGDNSLGGVFPTEALRKLTSLKHLRLNFQFGGQKDSFTGTISSDICGIDSLEELLWSCDSAVFDTCPFCCSCTTKPLC
mmetsp:Transcript_19745/g.28543  ORF Transcript_19745/g.28543 Transcript_19745/m.28543 type:complete len:604 (-) Transcript_19745:47-1858(-)